MNDDFRWMKHDPAGFMFSTINSSKQSRMIRFSCELKNEDIEPERLKEAVKLVWPRFVAFHHRAKSGFFWGYLERTDKLPKVEEECYNPCILRRLGKDGGPEVVILYYKKRISLEANHILADGFGYMEFLKSIAAQYLVLGGDDISAFEGIRFDDGEAHHDEYETPYYKYATKEKIPQEKRQNTYIIPKNYNPDGESEFIYNLMPTDSLLAKSRERGMTITEYLATALIYAIIKNSDRPITETILIAVPFNLRKYFPHNSVRNFTNDIPITFCPEGKTEISFDEIASEVKGQLKAKNTPEFHLAFLNKAISLVNNPVLCAIPFAIKHFGFNKIQMHTHKRDMTVMLSNMGNIQLPSVMAEQVERFDFVPGDVRVYDLAMFCSCIGLNGTVIFTFTKNGSEADIPKYFADVLEENGVSVKVETTEGKDGNYPIDRKPLPKQSLLSKPSQFSFEKVKAFFNFYG